MNKSSVLFLLIFVGFISCQRKELEIPKPTTTQSDFDLEVSDIYFPLIFPVSQLEDWLNRKFSKKFLKHTVDIEEDLEILNLEISRSSRIKLDIVDNKVSVAFPVRIDGDLTKKNRKGNERERNITAEAVLHLIVSPDVDGNWSLITNTIFERLEWVKEPRLRLGFIRFNVKGIVESFIENEKDKLIRQLDSVIIEKVSLKKDINKIWRDIQKPIPIRKDAPKAYLQLFPQTVSGNILISEETDIMVNLHVRAFTNITTDSVATTEFIPLVKFEKHKNVSNDEFEFNLLATIPYNFISDALNNQISGIEIGTSVFNVRPSQFYVYGSESSLVVRFEVSGDLNGTVLITGMPEFDPDNCKLTITGLNYAVEMEGYFINTLANSIQSLLLDRISNFLVLDIEDILSELPTLITQSIERSEKSNIFGITFDKLVINEVNHRLNRDNIQILLHTQAAMILDLRTLPVKKKLRLNK